MTADKKKMSGFTCRVRSAEVPDGGLDVVAEANADQRAAIARQLGLEGLDLFRIEAVAKPWRRHGLRVSGRLIAKVIQKCVVTLEPVSNDIEEDFEATFEPAAKVRRAAAEKEIVFDALEENDPPEQMIDGAADVGSLTIEYLALALDPYPRKPGVGLEEVHSGDPDLPEEPGAFDILRKLK